jgi:SAM-dependent methyltransferase
MRIFKTEVTSDHIISDNPIHQRLLKPYVVVSEQVEGDILELGCGEGRGLDKILPAVDSYLGIDKIQGAVDSLIDDYPKGNFKAAVFPPFKGLADNYFSAVISFQVIEHVKDDALFLKEIYRVLKPGGTAIISTPNIKLSISRNPWHIREYTADELGALTNGIFDKVEMKGISGNDKVMGYFENNRKSVQKIMKFDIFNLQHNLPTSLLKIPYEILNRINRNKLKNEDDSLVNSISYSDYIVTDSPDKSLDLFYYLYKK